MGYQEKFKLLKPWLSGIIETVKKDLKSEHLKVDKEFCRRYFLGKHFNYVQPEEMAEAYYQDILNGNIGLGEFIASRWLLKNTDIYALFEKSLTSISDHFDQLEVLSEEESRPLIKVSTEQFGATKTYLFAILNSVVFPQELYDTLRKQATEETIQREEEIESKQIEESLETMQKRHNREISAMQDRYEKKLNGMQRKYVRDMEMLKRQVSQLQKKLTP